ncbi:MAG: hypothetical protein ACRDHC_09565 [Actinomycetota bacterium]
MKRFLWWYDSAAAWERSPVAHRVAQVTGYVVAAIVTAAIVVFLAVGAWSFLTEGETSLGGGGDTCVETPDGFDCRRGAVGLPVT